MNLVSLVSDNIDLPSTYQTMLKEISYKFPKIIKATKKFNKTQSQFMDNMMTLSQPTELRSLRQILAQINRSKTALEEAYFSIQKKNIEIKRRKQSLEANKNLDELDKESLYIEIAELKSQINNIMGSVEGAIRKISAYMNQYENILGYLGKDEITEEDFEKDEERYHIMKAFEQALCAARARSGIIDEGNHIYFYQIGISGTAAQIDVANFLGDEGLKITAGDVLDHSDTRNWMRKMAKKYCGCAKIFAENKGMRLLDENSLHKENKE